MHIANFPHEFFTMLISDSSCNSSFMLADLFFLHYRYKIALIFSTGCKEAVLSISFQHPPNPLNAKLINSLSSEIVGGIPNILKFIF